MSDASFLTETEIADLQLSSLNRDLPFVIRSVTTSQFSVARHYGGMNYNGTPYTYIQETDEAIRIDVMAFVAEKRRVARKKEKQEQADAKRKRLESIPTLF